MKGLPKITKCEKCGHVTARQDPRGFWQSRAPGAFLMDAEPPHREVFHAPFDFRCACGGKWTKANDLELHIEHANRLTKALEACERDLSAWLKQYGGECLVRDEARAALSAAREAQA